MRCGNAAYQLQPIGWALKPCIRFLRLRELTSASRPRTSPEDNIRLTSRLGKEGNRLSAHSLRKFHTTALEAEMNPHWIAKLQGKSVGNSMGPYSQPEVEPDKLTKAYMAAYDELRVFGPSEEEARRDAEIVKLTKRLEEQEDVIEDATS